MKYWSSPPQLDLPAEPQPTGAEDARPRRLRFGQWLAHLIAFCVGIVGLACALALPFAPVFVDRTEVHWPAVEAESTTAFFAPYRPASFDASVPCPVLRAALNRPDRTTVLSTLPRGSDREGLVLTARLGEPELVLGQQEVPLPPGACELAIHADSWQTVVTVDNHPPITLPGIAAPEIFTFATDLEPPQAAGLSVTARTYSWFDTEPTDVKHTLISTALLLALASLVLLFVHAPPALAAVRLRPLLLPVDAAVAAVLAGWLVIGPLTDDDGFAMMTIRNYDSAGDIGNYYRWFNSSETPFTLVQHLMRWVSEYSLAPAWLRVPSAIAGLLTWIIVSRGIVAPVCRGTRRLPLHLLTAVFFLACWLPFGLGIRPEPFVALGTSALVAALLKISRTRAPHFWLGVAALIAGLTVAITPTGISALLIVLVFAPRIGRVLAQRGAVPRWISVPTRVVLVGCLSAVGLVAMFADSTLNGVQQATDLHDEFGPSLGWYQEIDRYAGLLSTTIWGSSAKRLAVFLVVTAVLIAASCAMRQVHRWTGMTDLPVLLGSVAAILAGLWLTPSKWSHHFGAFAGVGSALLAVTVVLLARVGKLGHAKREARLLGVFGGIAASVAAALAFMGPNIWPMQSDFGMPWSDTPVQPDLPLDDPVLWLSTGVAIGLLTFGFIRIRAMVSHRKPNSLMWPAVPSSVLGLAALASVLVLIGSFVSAPQAMGDRFSIARMNSQSIRASSCGMENEVETLPIAASLVPVDGAAELDGFAVGGAPPQEPDLREEHPGEPLRPTQPPDPKAPEDAVAPTSASQFAWTSQVGGPQTTGSLTSRWFGLPQLTGDQTLSVWVSGRPEQGNSLTLEFGTAQHRLVRSVGARELRDPPPTDLPFDDPRHGRPIDWRDFRAWRLLTVEAAQIPAGADRVRVLAEDRTSDEQGWLAIGGPVVRDVVPLRQALDGQQPVLIDWPMSFVFPCLFDYPQVSHGTAASPRMLVTPPGGEASMAFGPAIGGVFAGVPMLSRRFELPSRLRNAPGTVWGHLYAVRYEAERDAYTTTQHRERITGADGDTAYPFEEH
ncbi:arabinosyltransferase domain-containing protein [Saccharopolyspora sp. K220]|uniref:arabinosyltransferase domain-containing protein n=1 Tax=Saccharopolyspora soli TaxID=2926618 RepID=UPI001F58082A|nr:arabinosyltransferase domain-containing protein [Saccharopolyspora soli]MCI2418680.1 arabinosyltransferase domain-containing protein [Saccharopolyspora soli]